MIRRRPVAQATFTSSGIFAVQKDGSEVSTHWRSLQEIQPAWAKGMDLLFRDGQLIRLGETTSRSQSLLGVIQQRLLPEQSEHNRRHLTRSLIRAGVLWALGAILLGIVAAHAAPDGPDAAVGLGTFFCVLLMGVVGSLQCCLPVLLRHFERYKRNRRRRRKRIAETQPAMNKCSRHIRFAEAKSPPLSA
jgi:hypothetical protein